MEEVKTSTELYKKIQNVIDCACSFEEEEHEEDEN